MVGVGVEPLAREEQIRKLGEVVTCEIGTARILLLDRSEGRRSREERLDAVFGDHPPEGAGVGRPDRLSFVENRRAASEERRVHDVGMADCPAKVGGRPEHLAGMGVVDRLHAPAEGHSVSAVVADDALRQSGRPRRIEDVQRVRGSDWGARSGLGSRRGLAPVEVAAREELGPRFVPLENDAVLGTMARLLERAVEERLVLDDAVDLDAARAGEHDLRPRVVDSNRQLVRGEPAEDDGVDGAQASAREHGEDRLRHHRHVDDDRVAVPDPEPGQRSCQDGDLVAELGVGEDADRPRNRAVVDQRRLVRAAAVGVTVESVLARVQDAAAEPTVEGDL